MTAEAEKENLKDLKPGQRLGVLLDHLGMTQTDLARICGRSRQYVNNIIQCKQSLIGDFPQQLAEVTGVDLHWLYTGRGPMLRPRNGEALAALTAEALSVEELVEETARRLRMASERLGKIRRRARAVRNDYAADVDPGA